MKLSKIIGGISIGAICLATGGLAAPLAGAAIAANVLNSSVLVLSAAGAIASTVAEGEKSKKENEELRKELKKSNMDNATKQKVIQNLNKRIEKLEQALAEETEKRQRDEEKIRILQEQVDDLFETYAVACAA